MDSNAKASRALGSAVRDARLRRGLTQEQVAASAGIGTSTLRQIEAGNAHGPSLFAVLRLVAALGEDLAILDEPLQVCVPESTAQSPRSNSDFR